MRIDCQADNSPQAVLRICSSATSHQSCWGPLTCFCCRGHEDCVKVDMEL